MHNNFATAPILNINPERFHTIIRFHQTIVRMGTQERLARRRVDEIRPITCLLQQSADVLRHCDVLDKLGKTELEIKQLKFSTFHDHPLTYGNLQTALPPNF
jgi:hypothetical protein